MLIHTNTASLLGYPVSNQVSTEAAQRVSLPAARLRREALPQDKLNAREAADLRARSARRVQRGLARFLTFYYVLTSSTQYITS